VRELKLSHDLPEVPPERLTAVGSLARRVACRADLTAVHPLLDALWGEGRDADARAVLNACRDLASRLAPGGDFTAAPSTDVARAYAWTSFSKRVVGAAFWDVYDLGACLNVASGVLDPDTLCDIFDAVRKRDEEAMAATPLPTGVSVPGTMAGVPFYTLPVPDDGVDPVQAAQEEVRERLDTINTRLEELMASLPACMKETP